MSSAATPAERVAEAIVGHRQNTTGVRDGTGGVRCNEGLGGGPQLVQVGYADRFAERQTQKAIAAADGATARKVRGMTGQKWPATLMS
jgi:hypothetical protein